MRPKTVFSLLFLLACNIAVIFLFRESLITQYFQDDWYSLTISKINSPFGIINFFLPNRGVVYYRPLGMQLPFFLNTLLFNINPLPFRLLTFFTHALNSILVFIFFRKFIKSYFASLLAGFLYVTSAVNYIPFFWSSTYAFILGPTFTLLSAIFFFDFLEFKKNKKLYLSLIFFILGILTFEIIAVFPLILILYVYLFSNRKNILYLLPFLLLSVIYLLFRFLFLPPPDIPDYHFSLSKETFLNIKYYFLWAFNWPEEIKNQFIRFWQVNPVFIKNFRNFYSGFRITLAINLSLLFIMPFCLALFKKIEINYRQTVFGLIWFFVGLLPVIFFPKHAFPYYLPLSLIGLLIIILPIFTQSVFYLSRKKMLLVWIFPAVLMLNWLWSVSLLVDFNSLVHWAPRRGRLSARLIKTALNKVKSPYQFFVVLVNPDSENRLALNDQDAMKIIFQLDNLKTVYSNENITGYRL